jgi:hypothetical protein
MRDHVRMVRAKRYGAWAATFAVGIGALAFAGRGARAEARVWEVLEGAALPAGADGLPLRTVRAHGSPSVTLRAREVVAARDALLVIDTARRLLELSADRKDEPLVRVLAEPVRVAPFVVDGERFAYVRPSEVVPSTDEPAVDPVEGPVDLVLREGGGDRVLVRADRVTAFLGARGDDLVYVAEDAHGTPGLRAVGFGPPSKGALPRVRCLTNCALGAEGARDPAFVPLPASLAEAP